MGQMHGVTMNGALGSGGTTGALGGMYDGRGVGHVGQFGPRVAMPQMAPYSGHPSQHQHMHSQ